MASSTVAQAGNLIRDRLTELEDEKGRLSRALAELGNGDAPSPARRPKLVKEKAPSKTRRRRNGTRADQAVALVKANPGISASEIADRLKIKANYLYRVLADLEKEGRVKKDGRTYSV